MEELKDFDETPRCELCTKFKWVDYYSGYCKYFNNLTDRDDCCGKYKSKKSKWTITSNPSI